jgi:hypothetical protein
VLCSFVVICLSRTDATELRDQCSKLELSKSAMRKSIASKGLGFSTVNSTSRCAHKDGEGWTEDERD